MVINEILISQNFLNYNLKFFIVKIVVKINAHAKARVEICTQTRARPQTHMPTGARSCTHAPTKQKKQPTWVGCFNRTKLKRGCLRAR